MDSKSVLVIGGGLAGLSSAVVLAEAGLRVTLLEKRPHLGGRATSYLLPDGEHVDNCQHVTLGCCTNLWDFYRRVGVAHKIRYYDRVVFLDRLGRRGVLKRSLLPAPFHLSLSFLRFPFLTWEDKRAISRAMLRIARSGGRASSGAGSTMLDWLRNHGQTPAAIERVWRVVLVSALNEELDRAEDRYGLEVFWKAFLRNRRGFEIGIPTVPLAALYDGCRVAIERHGGEVRTRAAIRSLRFENRRVTAAILDDGSELTADYFISAVPHDAVLPLVPPKLAQKNATFAGLANLRTSPITGVHLWLDRQVTDEPFLALLDRTTQWVFNKSKLYSTVGARHAVPGSEDSSHVVGARHAVPVLAPGTAPPTNANIPGQYLQLVISASYDLVERSRQEITGLAWRELCEALPAAREAKLLKSTVIKEVAATFSPAPGCDRWRPRAADATFAVANLFLAGDWTNTGWPATMEGAVISGYLAAQALLYAAGLLDATGHAKVFIVGDLPAEGLARRWEAE